MIRALFSLRDRSQVLLPLLHGILLALPVAVVTGSVVAFFLWALDRMIELQWSHPGLLWGLPVAGAVVGLLYHRHGRGSEKGNNLLIEEIHQPGGGVPVRMAPLVLLGTLVTHLFGGSAGREGTAVQMGGSVA
ncbi:MAG: voltage-gated chloride channel protein, partial [Verrucomicrobiaceae bacterium]